MPKSSSGAHYILELNDCPFSLLDDEDFIRQCVREGARAAGSTLLDLSSRKFTPQGVTAVALLAESHLSIHTWPEQGYAAVDIFTCGAASTPEKACEHLKHKLQAQQSFLQCVLRGPDIDHETFADEVPF